MGKGYEFLASLLPEVTGAPLEAFWDCSQSEKMENNSELVGPHTPYFLTDYKSLSWAGKLMGYAATGKAVEDLRPLVRFFFEATGSPGDNNFPAPLLRAACASVERQRDLAATIQLEFEDFLEGRVQKLLEHVGPLQVEGIVLTGGCGLNVLANQRIHDLASMWTLDVHVPPAPNDSGLSLGAVWSVSAPKVRQPLQYLGFPLWDEDKLARFAWTRGAQHLPSLGGVDYLADLLVGGDAWIRQRNGSAEKPIIAVVRGRQEFGPRALGHRSLLAVPDSHEMRERMNRLKVRQWYRPVAPMIAQEALLEVFGRSVASPYMTMAPQVLPEIRDRFPALAHLDGTARHQSVSSRDEPWIHALLMAVGKRIGLAALINTSFNTKGKPIVNTIKECISMLDNLPDLDFVVIEDWIFRKRNGGKRPWPAPSKGIQQSRRSTFGSASRFSAPQELEGDFLLNPLDDCLSTTTVAKGAKIYSDFVKPRQIWEAKKWLESMAEHSKCQEALELLQAQTSPSLSVLTQAWKVMLAEEKETNFEDLDASTDAGSELPELLSVSSAASSVSAIPGPGAYSPNYEVLRPSLAKGAPSFSRYSAREAAKQEDLTLW
eukprot:symbB.v1.2.021434.t1/scaffold1851.1/size98778/5